MRVLKHLMSRFPVIFGWAAMILLISMIPRATGEAQLFVAVLLLVLGVWLAVWAPAQCLAPTRAKQRCRNNARGWLGGCHLQAHKRMSIVERLKPSGLAPFSARDLLGGVSATVAFLGSLGSLAGGVVAGVQYLGSS